MAMKALDAVPLPAAVKPERAAPELSGRTLRRGGITYATTQYLGMALGFIGSTLMVRMASPQDVASYLLLLQAITALGLTMQLGLGPAALRFAPICRGEGGTEATGLLRRRLFKIQIVLWLVIVPPLALVWPWIARRLASPELAKATPLLVGAAILASFGNLVDNYLRAFRMYPSSAMLTHFLPRAVLLGGFLSLWLTSSHDVPWEVLISLYLAAQLAAGLGFGLSLPRTTAGETSEPRKAQPPPGTRTILGATTAMGLRSAASVLFVSSDLWVLAWARPHTEVAVYGIASRVLQIMGAIPGVANFLIPQEFSVMYTEGRTDEMEKLARTASTSVAMIAGASLLFLVLIGRPAIRLAFGPTYVASWGILLILAVGSFWDTASGSAGFALQMSGNHNRLFYLTAGAAVFNLAFSLTLAPRWGGYGVATATTTTLILLNLAMVWSAKRLVGVRTFAYLNPARWREILRFAWNRGEAERHEP
jgi:O-antigen/teichoic acid export membrane protein